MITKPANSDNLKSFSTGHCRLEKNRDISIIASAE